MNATPETPWASDREVLARSREGARVRALIDEAGACAQAGNLAAAAERLETVRQLLVGHQHFKSHDDDIWAFAGLIGCLRRLSPEKAVPAAYQRFIDAGPPKNAFEDLSPGQADFWYKSPPPPPPTRPGATCLKGHTERILGVAISPDGTRALSCGWDGTVRLWDTRTGRELRCLKGHTGFVSSAAFTPDGRRAVSGGGDRAVRVWDLESGKELHRLRGHTFTIFALACSSDGRRALSGGTDIRLWDLERGRQLRKFGGGFFAKPVRGDVVALSPDGRRALSGSIETDAVTVWDVESGKEVRQLTGHGGICSVAFLPDSGRAITSDRKGAVRMWDVEAGQVIGWIEHKRPMKGQFDPEKPYATIEKFAVSADGRRLVSATVYDSDAVYVFDLAQRRTLDRLAAHTKAVTSLAISADGRRAVSGSDDWTAMVWEVG